MMMSPHVIMPNEFCCLEHFPFPVIKSSHFLGILYQAHKLTPAFLTINVSQMARMDMRGIISYSVVTGYELFWSFPENHISKAPNLASECILMHQGPRYPRKTLPFHHFFRYDHGSDIYDPNHHSPASFTIFFHFLQAGTYLRIPTYHQYTNNHGSEQYYPTHLTIFLPFVPFSH